MTSPARCGEICAMRRGRVFCLFVLFTVSLIAHACFTSGCAATHNQPLCRDRGTTSVGTISVSALKLPSRTRTLAQKERVIQLKVEG